MRRKAGTSRTVKTLNGFRIQLHNIDAWRDESGPIDQLASPAFYEIPMPRRQQPTRFPMSAGPIVAGVNQMWAATVVMVETGAGDWQERRVREWLLLLLRFAITREVSDQTAVLAMADELDALGPQSRNAPKFFQRTSESVCEAILWDGRQKNAVLRTHISRIDEPRLREAFRAAVGLQPRVGGAAAAGARYFLSEQGQPRECN